MIRVLHYGLSQNLGGIETFIYKLSKNIDRKEYQFDFLVIGASNPCFYEELLQMGCNFYKIASRRENPIKNHLQLKKVLEEGNYDVLHCHMNSLSYITPILLGLKSVPKVIVHSHNSQCNKKKSAFMHKINAMRLPMSKLELLAVSDVAGAWMFGQSDYMIVNNGVDESEFVFNSDFREKIREKHEIKPEEKIILHVGAFREQKNHDFIIDVFYEVNNMDSNYKLFLLGEGSLQEEIREKVKSLGLEGSVSFLGTQTNTAAFLSAADVFLFPSLYEGFPIALIEAECNGLKSIVANTISEEAIIPEMCQVLSLNDGVDKWAESIVATNPLPNRMIGVKEIAKRGYTIEKEISSLIDIYKS